MLNCRKICNMSGNNHQKTDFQKHLQTGVCSFWEEVLEYPEQKNHQNKQPETMGRRCGAEKTERKILICQEAVTTFLTEKYISHHRGFFQLQ